MAYRGLDSAGVDAADRDRLLGIIEQRCLTGRNGATWMAEAFRSLHGESTSDRFDVLRQVTGRYRELMNTNEPAHGWEVP